MGELAEEIQALGQKHITVGMKHADAIRLGAIADEVEALEARAERLLELEIKLRAVEESYEAASHSVDKVTARVLVLKGENRGLREKLAGYDDGALCAQCDRLKDREGERLLELEEEHRTLLDGLRDAREPYLRVTSERVPYIPVSRIVALIESVTEAGGGVKGEHCPEDDTHRDITTNGLRWKCWECGKEWHHERPGNPRPKDSDESGGDAVPCVPCKGTGRQEIPGGWVPCYDCGCTGKKKPEPSPDASPDTGVHLGAECAHRSKGGECQYDDTAPGLRCIGTGLACDKFAPKPPKPYVAGHTAGCGCEGCTPKKEG